MQQRRTFDEYSNIYRCSVFRSSTIDTDLEERLMRKKYTRHKPTARQQAILEGKKTYLGRPCKHGHGKERHIPSGLCTTCYDASMNRITAWQRGARDHYNEYSRKAQARWREENRDWYNRRAREWRAKQKLKEQANEH